MIKKSFILHRWHGQPSDDWYPWLKKELLSTGYETKIVDFPDSTKPVIAEWVKHLNKAVGDTDNEVILIGHSIGCQTILRYVETLPPGKIINKIILVAPWAVLQNFDSDKTQNQIIKPWINTPINYKKIKQHCQNIYAIFSDNDYIVPMINADIFKQKLDAKIFIEHGKNHFFATANGKPCNELPVALDCVRSND